MHPLVSTQWLQDHLNDPDLVILDARGHILPANQPLPHYFSHHEEYLQSHIPGARFVDWVRDITIDGPQKMQIAPPEKFEALMSSLGIGADTIVVTYDDAGAIFAARLWWALNYYGHEKVAVLDGGWKAWIAEVRPTTDILPTIVLGEFIAVADPEIRRTKEQVLAALGSEMRLIDVRSPAEFRAEASRAKRKGHIPGAKSFPAKEEMTAANGLVVAPELLREKFAAAGVAGDGEDVVTYCNSGVSSSLGLLAYRAAGFEGGAVYDGSWKEWGNDESLPME